jgi:hypothetical protein
MASRILVLFAGLIVSVVAAHSLSSEEQGYFFTFLSIVAAQTLFELGITNLILHHLSHACAGILHAKDDVQKRLAQNLAESTRAYSLRYFRRAAGLFLLIIGPGGALFFAWSQQSTQGIQWQLPWVLMVAGTALSLFNLNYYSYLEAFGRLNISYRIRMTATALLIVIFIAATFSVGGLACYALALLASNLYALVALRGASIEVNRDFGLGSIHTPVYVNIGREQRKMAASAVAGYITANSFTPYAFHFFGASVAGQVGLTMSIFAAIAAVAMARTTAEAPTYGLLIASGNLTELMRSFRKTLQFSICLAAVLGFGVIAMRQIGLTIIPQYEDRVMDLAGFVVVSLLIISNVTLSVTSTALRAFKTEQLMWPSIAAGFLIIAAQLALMLNPMHCLALLAAFNGLIFYPFARRRLTAQISA